MKKFPLLHDTIAEAFARPLTPLERLTHPSGFR